MAPQWPEWSYVENTGWTARTRSEWDKAWAYARDEARKTGHRVRSTDTESTPWGALHWA